MPESPHVQNLLARARRAEGLAAAEEDADRKAAWLRVAALSFLLAERLLVEESERRWQSGMTMQ